jgi:hypothetical protein
LKEKRKKKPDKTGELVLLLAKCLNASVKDNCAALKTSAQPMLREGDRATQRMLQAQRPHTVVC